MNTVLNMTSEKKVFEWSKIITNTLSNGVDIYVVADTETTGTNELGDKDNFGKKDRILEIGMLFYTKNKEGTLSPLLSEDREHIFFHEYINPFKEDEKLLDRYNSIRTIPEHLSLTCHGIDADFLEAKNGLLKSSGERAESVLERPAPSFLEAKAYMEVLLDIHNIVHHPADVFFIAHNALFDIKFMSAEWIKCETFEEKNKFPASFEAYVKIIDTMRDMQNIYTSNELAAEARKRGLLVKAGFSLDFLQKFYGIEIERDMHGALLDSKILAELYNSIVNDKKHQNSIAISKNININYTRQGQATSGLKRI